MLESPDLGLALHTACHPDQVRDTLVIPMIANTECGNTCGELCRSALNGCVTHGISASTAQHVVEALASEWDEINSDDTSTRNPRSADSHQDLQDR
jgi:hypothetical protein